MGVQNQRRNGSRPARVAGGRFKIKHELIASQQADLLRLVRAGEDLSRIKLARTLNLAPSTVGIYVDHLVAAGFLFEGRAKEREFGRPPTILTLNPSGGRFVGVDFEARNIMAVAVDFSQQPLKQYHDRITAADSVPSILDKIEHAIRHVIAEDKQRVLGIGLGVPGLADPERGMALYYKHIPGWQQVALVERLSKRFKVPVFLENNIRTMALAELWFGQGRGVKNFICLGARSGIGAGIVIDGHIYRGAGNRAGEIGDWPSALAPRAGGKGCKGFATLEEVASFKSVQEELAPAGSKREVTVKQLVEAAQAGDKRVLQVLDNAARTFGLALAQLNCAFNPEKIIMAGAFTAFGDLFLDRLNHYAKDCLMEGSTMRVVNSTLGEFNGAFGAAALAVHEWKPAVD